MAVQSVLFYLSISPFASGHAGVTQRRVILLSCRYVLNSSDRKRSVVVEHCALWTSMSCKRVSQSFDYVRRGGAREDINIPATNSPDGNGPHTSIARVCRGLAGSSVLVAETSRIAELQS